jgi:predicted RNA-binding Zn-ribbon protein involved in translation (DUF1610 family)
MILKFKCPKCGGTEVEEVMTDVVQYSVIDVIDDSGAVDYKEKGVSHAGGMVNHYQCNACGDVIGEDGEAQVGDEEDLVEWIKRNCPQEKENAES